MTRYETCKTMMSKDKYVPVAALVETNVALKDLLRTAKCISPEYMLKGFSVNYQESIGNTFSRYKIIYMDKEKDEIVKTKHCVFIDDVYYHFYNNPQFQKERDVFEQ
jgi:hypothetical protein